MQVEPQAAPSVFVTTAGGGVALEPGRQVVARVIEVSSSGSARISLGGTAITVRSDVPLAAGDTLSLTVSGTAAGSVRLSIDGATGTAASHLPGVSQQLDSFAPAAIRELARAGIAVTPQLAQAARQAIEQLAIGAGGPGADDAARTVANLVARDIALGPQTAGRVAAALSLAGRLGPALGSLAAQSPEVASALPASSASASALRSVLAPALSPVELAVARIAQATEAARVAQAAAPATSGALHTPPTSSPAVVANYVASQVAGTARLDDLARASLAPALDRSAAAAQSNASSIQGGASAPGVAAQAHAARLRGELAAELVATQRGGTPAPAGAALVPTVPGAPAGAAGSAAADPGSAAAARAARTNAGAAAAATSAAAGNPQPAISRAVAELATALTRLAPAIASGPGPMGTASATHARGAATDAQAPAGTFTPQVAGGAASGAPAPLVAGLREALSGTTAGHDQRAAHGLLALLGRYDAHQLGAALGQLGESASLRLAGTLMDIAGRASQSLSGASAAELRHAVHNMLDDIGRALAHGGVSDHTVLRAALELVAANDPRPAVADQATRLLHAMDGQQLLSQQRSGADPGFVYFQVPLPGNRSAEVLVRREPGRRQVTFDTFDIAFLLDTESLGSLLVQLSAHPAAVQATIKTEHAALEPFLAAQADALRLAVEPEARRPVLVSTGVFEGGAPPASLLDEPALGLIPGENAYYA